MAVGRERQVDSTQAQAPIVAASLTLLTHLLSPMVLAFCSAGLKLHKFPMWVVCRERAVRHSELVFGKELTLHIFPSKQIVFLADAIESPPVLYCKILSIDQQGKQCVFFHKTFIV